MTDEKKVDKGLIYISCFCFVLGAVFMTLLVHPTECPECPDCKTYTTYTNTTVDEDNMELRLNCYGEFQQQDLLITNKVVMYTLSSTVDTTKETIQDNGEIMTNELVVDIYVDSQQLLEISKDIAEIYCIPEGCYNLDYCKLEVTLPAIKDVYLSDQNNSWLHIEHTETTLHTDTKMFEDRDSKCSKRGMRWHDQIEYCIGERIYDPLMFIMEDKINEETYKLAYNEG